MKAIADTGFLFDANARDMHHNWALSIAEQIFEFTTETSARLFR
jgi:hypothetical protein